MLAITSCSHVFSAAEKDLRVNGILNVTTMKRKNHWSMMSAMPFSFSTLKIATQKQLLRCKFQLFSILKPL